MKTRVTTLVCARLVGAAVLLIVPTVARAQADQSTDGSYGFVRTVDGSAYLVETGTGQRTDVQANEPVLTGDDLFVSARSRVELLLSDRNIVRLGDRAELEFASLAGSPDGSADHTVLRLSRGSLQLVVVDDFVGGFFPTVETPSGTIDAEAVGSYLVVIDSRGTTVTVRSGAAELITSRGTARVRAGDQLFVDASGSRSPSYAPAGPLNGVELWGDDLAAAAYAEEVGYVDASLAYAAAPLARYGRWVSVGGRRAWYPRYRSGWRPYWNGHWRYTPTGLLWVSYEPWGWVPYHYGVWDEVPGYGWLWFPGRRFAPAWVAWYWGPAYVGWTPLGFYAGYYSSGFRIAIGFGTYGWGYGPAGRFRGFTFVPGNKFGRRNQHKWARRGYDLGRSGHVFKRGIITTDTRSIAPPRWRRPADIVRGLDEEGRRRRGGRDLPDASPLGGRLQRLPAQTERVALGGGPERGRAPGAAGNRPTSGSRTATRPTDRGRMTSRAPERRMRAPAARPSSGVPRATPPRAGRERPAATGPRSPDRPSAGDRPSASGPWTRERPTTRERPSARGPSTRSRPSARGPSTRSRSSAGERPSRVGPGADRGRVKVTEPTGRRPKARERQRAEEAGPIARGPAGRPSGERTGRASRERTARASGRREFGRPAEARLGGSGRARTPGSGLMGQRSAGGRSAGGRGR